MGYVATDHCLCHHEDMAATDIQMGGSPTWVKRGPLPQTIPVGCGPAYPLYPKK